MQMVYFQPVGMLNFIAQIVDIIFVEKDSTCVSNYVVVTENEVTEH